MSKLTAQNISKSFDGKKVLKDVTLSLNEGELVCIVGVSGVGKSTFFNILSGLLTPDIGRIVLDGTDITGSSGHISYMQQKDLLLPWKTVLNNIILPLTIRGTRKSEAKSIALSHFKQFGIEGYENKYPSQLSGGMRQRAALLRTYLFSSDLILLDEPFSSLDPITKSSMHTWYLKLCSSLKISTVFITHDIEEAILLSDRICIMSGSPASITDEFKIDIKKPRSIEDTTSEHFIEYKKQIYKLLIE
ncbi:MAG: ABC transporter ATP-binding protein [Clostridiales bacterium]|jgi:ABC-type nitrate/sulfonate/bicarbonate transport system ATPase subunit|nr:ABC transporter ATP-binding protein [Clostridiales bacterium]